jgi:hypothetical protein
MSYLKRISDGAITNDLDSDGEIYRSLVALRDVSSRPTFEDVSSEQKDAATTRLLAARLEAVAVGVDDTARLSDGEPDNFTVTAASFTPDTAFNGADTNSRTIQVISGPQLASPVIIASKAYTNGVNGVAGQADALTLGGVVAVPAGQEVIAKSLHVGTGIAGVAGLVLVTYTN